MKGGQVSEPWEEKADRSEFIPEKNSRQYNKAKAGMICAVTGLKHTFQGGTWN